jgi:hypothetical protein
MWQQQQQQFAIQSEDCLELFTSTDFMNSNTIFGNHTALRDERN